MIPAFRRLADIIAYAVDPMHIKRDCRDSPQLDLASRSLFSQPMPEGAATRRTRRV